MVASKGMREWGSEMVDMYEHVQLVETKVKWKNT
jgi:hypothetical protein